MHSVHGEYLVVLVATEEFLAEMDEDMEVMQGTVYLMQQQLMDTRERLQKYECCAAAAPFPSLDAPNSQNSSVGDEVCSEEASTKTELPLKVENQDKSSISETDSAVETCWDMVIDGAREVELSGRQALNEIEGAVGVNLDGVVIDRDGENHDEFSASANDDAAASRNSGLRPSPVKPSDFVENLPMPDSFSGDSNLKSDVVCVDADLPCHKLRIVGRKNSDILTDVKVNGLNTLVPVTEENN